MLQLICKQCIQHIFQDKKFSGHSTRSDSIRQAVLCSSSKNIHYLFDEKRPKSDTKNTKLTN